VVTYHALGSVKRRHQGSQDPSPHGRVAAEADIGRRADGVVATCRDEVRELEQLGVPASQVQVVPCGVDADLFRPGATSPDVPPRSQPHRLVSLGRLVERKGVDLAIRAVHDLPGTELLVAGGPAPAELGGDRDVARLGALAAELGVADRVRFLGRVARADVPGLLCSADVVVATPWYEPFGIVPVEAAACGVPVVGAAVGGLLDTVLDGVTGRLVPPRDPAALTRAVGEILARPDMAAAYGATARRRALERYTWARVGVGTAAVYQRLVDAARLTQEVAS
jgi:glycosyltransferase involved in cell wall biosynthesis